LMYDRVQESNLSWMSHVDWMESALRRSGFTVDEEGWVARVEPIDPALYPPDRIDDRP